MSPASQYVALSHVLLHFFTCLVSVKSTVHGTEGENVTLPCRYEARYHGRTSICWGTGDLPSRGCNNEIIATDGDRVTSRKSSRYQLFGDLSTGNVSLTIVNSILSDTGKYSCRIHIPGWFNDEKYTRNLVVSKAPTPSSHSSTTSGPPVTESNTTAHHQNISTTRFTYTPQYSEVEGPQVSHDLKLLLAAVILSLVVVAVIVLTIFLIRKRWKKSQSFQRIQSSDNAVIYSNTGGSSLGLFSREMAVENIYHIDDSSDVYEEFNPA
ncbi:hepatitis A virus cellular receptor 1 homolog isoform X2 [Engraulis encrasicolus]|uniref:hepatitis A virus cellular receptor 1 homolog isoform X2 n=1 Tax=Engraulis encrasicolus TaxID=184585 RepID=UPI002FD71822